MKHILIDFENIQPNSFEAIENPEDYNIWLFLGVHQQKTLPYSLVKLLFRFPNTQVHLLEMQHADQNALDHYLSFYIGKISEIDKQAEVYILARNSSYAMLVDHLNQTYNGLITFHLTDIQSLSNCEQGTVVQDEVNQDSPLIHHEEEKNEVINTPQIIDSLQGNLSDFIKPTSPTFITHCFRITLKQIINDPAYLPKRKFNFLSAMKKYTLAHELTGYDEDLVDDILNKVLEKFVDYELIEINDNELTYKISQVDMFNSVKKLILTQRPATIEQLENFIYDCLQNLNQNTEVNEINLIIKWLKNHAVIFQKNNDISYRRIKSSKKSNDLLSSIKKSLNSTPVIE